jgi:endonuclease-3
MKPDAREDGKIPFDVKVALKKIRKAVEPFPKAALFQLATEGFTSTFEQLVACIVSIRTLDEVTLEIARKVFDTARTPAAFAKLSISEIDDLIRPSTFHRGKAQTLHDIAEKAVNEYDGELPCDEETLLSLKGVGPKCANLVLGIACDSSQISVDVHVHRVTNRWGYVKTATPEKTMTALQKKLPKRNWIELNRLLVPFGKHICTGRRPKCSTCVILPMCQQVDVKNPR